MTNEMEKPVTRGELFGEFLPALMAQLDKRFEQIDKRFEQMDKRFEQFRVEMTAVFATMAGTLRAESIQISEGKLDVIRGDLQTYDDKYSHLPARVTRLEEAVFKPAPQKRKRSR